MEVAVKIVFLVAEVRREIEDWMAFQGNRDHVDQLEKEVIQENVDRMEIQDQQDLLVFQ